MDKTKNKCYLCGRCIKGKHTQMADNESAHKRCFDAFIVLVNIKEEYQDYKKGSENDMLL